MKIYLVSYATSAFYSSQKRLIRSALKFGINENIEYNDKSLRKTKFYQENKSILEQKRLAGYALWKPYIILDTLQKLNDEDIVIYLDSDVEIIRDISPLISLCKQHKILFFKAHGHLNRVWTKRDCFVMMNCDSVEYYDAEQIMSGFHVWTKTERNINILKEWLHYNEQINIVSDLPNVCGLDNLPEFIENRHDQSILSLLAVKYNIESFRDASQFGNHMKNAKLRENGEWLYSPYSNTPSANSPYQTLLQIHYDIDRTEGFLNKFSHSLRKNLRNTFLYHIYKKILNYLE